MGTLEVRESLKSWKNWGIMILLFLTILFFLAFIGANDQKESLQKTLERKDESYADLKEGCENKIREWNETYQACKSDLNSSIETQTALVYTGFGEVAFFRNNKTASIANVFYNWGNEGARNVTVKCKVWEGTLEKEKDLIGIDAKYLGWMEPNTAQRYIMNLDVSRVPEGSYSWNCWVNYCNNCYRMKDKIKDWEDI